MVSDDSGPDRSRPGARLTRHSNADVAVVLAGAMLVLLLAGKSPGVHRLAPEPTAAVSSLVAAAAGLIWAGTLVALSTRVETGVEAHLDGPPRLVADLGAIAANAVLLVAVVMGFVAAGFAASPALEALGAVWLYAAAFALLAVGPLAMIGYHLHRSLDPAAEWLARYIDSVFGVPSVGDT